MANLKRTREDILKSVIETVHRQGLVATSLSELCAASGASSGSFYNYFRSKHDLGHALIEFEWSLLSSRVLAPTLDSDGDAFARVEAMLDRLEAKNLERSDCDGCLLGNLVVDLVEQDPSFRDHLTDVFDRWEQAIARVLDQAPLRPELDPDCLAEELLTIVEGTLLMSRLRRRPERIRRGFDRARQLLRDARCPEL